MEVKGHGKGSAGEWRQIIGGSALHDSCRSGSFSSPRRLLSLTRHSISTVVRNSQMELVVISGSP